MGENGYCIYLDFKILTPQNLTTLCICGGLVPEPPQIPKSEDAQISCIKWPRSMNTACFLHPWAPECRSTTLQVFTEKTNTNKKNPLICGSVQFKAMLFQGILRYIRILGEEKIEAEHTILSSGRMAINFHKSNLDKFSKNLEIQEVFVSSRHSC